MLDWNKFLSYGPSVPLIILSQYFAHFSNHGINFIDSLVDISRKYKSWDTIKYEYNLSYKEKFRWLELVHAIPTLWVEALNKDLKVSSNLAIYDHNLRVVYPR